MTRTTQTSRTATLAVSLAVMTGATTALAGCSRAQSGAGEAAGRTAAPSASRSAVAPSTTTPAGVAPVKVTVTPADGARGVEPAASVTVSATGGQVRDVVVTDRSGARVPGTVKDGAWTPLRRLGLDSTYSVRSVVSLSDGTSQTASSSFRTLKPATTAKYTLLPSDDTVGVGMPAIVQLASAVKTPQQRAEVERNVEITTVPAVEGSWGWLDDRQLMWRPKDYWKPGTRVTVNARLAGVQTGAGKYLGRDDTRSFTIGRSQVSTVDMRTHHMAVVRDGEQINNIPVTTGKPGFTTRSGTKVIMEKVSAMTMDSETVGIPKGSPEYYKLDTRWNMRITWTGEFLHAAPWSQWAQGRRNVSHGCTNMGLDDARWMFESSMVGDVVRFTGSDRPFEPTEGIGVWQYSWPQWQQQSALR
ncbi:Ig-like domain-containing protein [uncultured Arsenicicoccus sp.]|uniref:L,D-transpeptidase n=1 Tax=uncultured Arsenicicoccus sp. TaxID=491339 RepID=UPI00259214AF|nr:Ig-like domain-containing protein [uncultured Arsenicicoccus sp.]